MTGHLDLVVGLDATGRTVLQRQSFAPPIHLSKPHHDAGWLVVNLASPTPGLFAGDRVDVRVAVEASARLLITAPSASRLHTMTEGHAELQQTFIVARGAGLDVWPEYLIPQANSSYRQRTRIEVEDGASLLWTETVAPGRAARGEAFAFRDLRFALDVVHGAHHLVHERYRLQPPAGLAALTRFFPQAYYASILCLSAQPTPAPFPTEALDHLHDPAKRWVGATRLSSSAVAVKIVAAESPDLRSAVAIVRAHLQKWMGVEPASLRRVSGAPVRM